MAGLPPGVVGTSDPRTVQVNVVRQGEARLPVAVRLGRPEARKRGRPSRRTPG
ncbi:hypothetical protein [Hydrogenibacillus schlegelii]|uniref:hypothetical protein n=1 Tax=Hydrogenibacillus schlegelii TaxID=1484 RepID=UPI0034A0017D